MFFKRSHLIAISLAFLAALAADSDNLTIVIEANDYEVIDLPDGGQVIEMEEFGNLLEPGKPVLPAKVFLIGLPPGAEVQSVLVEGMDGVELPGSYEIIPTPPLVPTADGETIDEWMEFVRHKWVENYETTYGADEKYPSIVGQYLGSGDFRKYRFARVSFLPFAYNPSTKRLTFSPSAQVSIDYVFPTKGSEEALKVERLLSDRVGDRFASELLVNHADVTNWYSRGEKFGGSRQTYDYVIITTGFLQSAVSPLVTWKTNLGYSVNVVTTSWISSTYPGTDLQEEIRNFLIDKYPSNQWGIEWVLLAADIDSIPMRKCYPDPANHANDVPTDHYYADLTGNWDSDGDGFPGEYGQDNYDLVPEVRVGRIPFSDLAGLNYVCNKIPSFEADSGSWKNNTLMMGAILEYYNEDHSGWPGSDGADLHCSMAYEFLWPQDILVEAQGLSPSAWWGAPWLRDDSVTYANAISWWSSGRYGMVNLAGHGNSTSIARKIWSTDDGDMVPESFEFSWPSFVDVNTINFLNDAYPSIVFSVGCDNGYPEAASLGKALLFRGGSAVISSSRFCYHLQGWQYVPQGGSFTMNNMFSRYLLLDDAEVGEALFWAKIFYFNNYLYPGWEWTDLQNMYDFNLYGDPSMRRFPVPRPQVVSTSPAAHSPSASSVTNVQATFDTDMLAASIDTGRYGTFQVWGMQSGPRYQGTLQYHAGSRTATLTPANLPFSAGEEVIATLTEDIASTDTAFLDRHTFSFTTEAGNATNADFDSSVTVPVGGWPGPLAGGDFNRDGYIDLVVLDSRTNSDTFFVLTNDGHGGFLPTARDSLGSHPTSVCVVDADRDGSLDPVIACDTMMVILANDGLGNFPFQFQYSWRWGAGSSLRHLRTHDLGGRWTILDFALNFGGNDVAVLLHKDLSNGYARYDYYDLPGSGVGDLWLADVNLDGEVDMLGSMNPYVYPADSVWLMLNEGTGTFSQPSRLFYAGPGAGRLYGNDLNGDGWVDLATANVWGCGISVLLNDGAGGFNPPVAYGIGLSPCMEGPRRLNGSDLDGDGDIDLIAFDIWTGAASIDSLYVFTNNGSGVYSGPTSHALHAYPRDVFCADLDGDLDIDIAVSLGNYAPSYPIQILWNTGGGGVPDDFIRADANADSALTMGDAIYTLKYLYVPGAPVPTCMKSADSDDSGGIMMSDAVFTLQYLYVPGSPQPPLPFPGCGSDPTSDGLSCGSHPCGGKGQNEVPIERKERRRETR